MNDEKRHASPEEHHRILMQDNKVPEEWDKIDGTTQELLIEWYNTREEDLDAHDLHILAELHHSGNIIFGECVECGMTCYVAYPKSWDKFQGTGVGMMEGIYKGTATFVKNVTVKSEIKLRKLELSKMGKKLWLVVVWEDVEPSIIGPFEDDDKRLNAALEFRKREGKDHGLYRLNIDEGGLPELFPFSGGELEIDDVYCSKCGQSFAAHNDDGSCVED